MTSRFIACLLVAGFAQSVSAGAAQDNVATPGLRVVRTDDSTHLAVHALLWGSSTTIGNEVPAAVAAVAAIASIRAEPLMCSSYAAQRCGFGAAPSRHVSLWGLHLSGGSVVWAIWGADLSVRRRSATLSKSFWF